MLFFGAILWMDHSCFSQSKIDESKEELKNGKRLNTQSMSNDSSTNGDSEANPFLGQIFLGDLIYFLCKEFCFL